MRRVGGSKKRDVYEFVDLIFFVGINSIGGSLRVEIVIVVEILWLRLKFILVFLEFCV